MTENQQPRVSTRSRPRRRPQGGRGAQGAAKRNGAAGRNGGAARNGTSAGAGAGTGAGTLAAGGGASGGVFGVTSTPAPPPVTSFAEMGLPAPVLAELARQGVTEPFPIQAATLPSSLGGRDVLGRGRTGSGKTLAFGLALLARTAGQRAEPRQPLALVLVPTRELAQQVTAALVPYATALRLRTATVVGGLSLNRQAADLRAGAEVVVATPGRLRDLVERGDCALDQVAITVLDEADQMADLGFLPQVTALLRQVRPDGQRMLFSATLDQDVDRLVRRFLTDPAQHSVDPPADSVGTLRHHVLQVTADDKRAATVRIAARDGRVLLFLASKRAVDRLTKNLLASGVRAGALHGGKSQPQRTRVLEQFKNGVVTALVATNVAARGIHVDDLDLVVNVDPPADHKDYLHRGGRTARAGASGSVVTLVLPEQRRDMEHLLTLAAVSPQTAAVHSEGRELARITGARQPSGTPVSIPVPAAQAPAAGTGAGTGRRRGRGRRPSGGGSGAGAGSGASRSAAGAAGTRSGEGGAGARGARSGGMSSREGGAGARGRTGAGQDPGRRSARAGAQQPRTRSAGRRGRTA